MNVPKLVCTNPYDVILVVKDDREFKAQRRVLSEASPFFEKLLESDMKESKEGVIRLEILNKHQMADILMFIYTGHIDISTAENAKNMIVAADYLLLSNLKSVACKFLEQNMSLLNCLSSFYVAEEYHCEGLSDCAREFIHANFLEVAKTEYFMDLSSHELDKWISSDDIFVNVEEDVFRVILKWINHNKGKRNVQFSELFRHVRLTCVSRDFLLMDVVTNDLVKDNKDCLDGVTDALAWIDRAADCDVPRPHFPRKALETSVIAISGRTDPSNTANFLLVPEKDEFFGLPAERKEAEEHLPCGFIFSCRGKLFAVPKNIGMAQVYVPYLNRWMPAAWTKQTESNLPFVISGRESMREILVVENKICFIVENRPRNWSWLSQYDLDSNSSVVSTKWLNAISTCFVAVNSCIYAIGGMIDEISCDGDGEIVFPYCSRFDTKTNEWIDVAKLQRARYQAFGVGTDKKIFVAGGMGEFWENALKSCEMYDIETDEWHLMASLTVPRPYGEMLLVDQRLYVLSSYTSKDHKECKIEKYDPDKAEWVVKPLSPLMPDYFHCCSFTLFTGDLYQLERIPCDKN